MRFALSQLKWTPAAFWSATLCEVRAAAGIGHPAVLFSRQAMAQMMAAHPDLEPFKEHRT
ncbi:MAG: phage tail assembly chaperone [Roseibium sp.]|nr:phage tail assembly chaperone [Roseibium sp.]